MTKIIKRILFIILIILILYWLLSLLRCEILTLIHGHKFESNYKENTMIGEIDYLKVLDYSDTTARVYYVGKNKSGGDVLIFKNKNNTWVYDSWENTIWSRTGSADDVIFPYWWHFIYWSFLYY